MLAFLGISFYAFSRATPRKRGLLSEQENSGISGDRNRFAVTQENMFS
jgi:hypothetical protein